MIPNLLANVNIQNAFFRHNPGAANLTTPSALINRVLPNAIIGAGLVLFFIIIYGGFQLIMYGGAENPPARVAQAKNMITYGFLGFLLVTVAYFILYLLGMVTGINFLNPNLP